MIDLSKAVFVMDGPSDIRAFTEKFQKEFGTCPEFRKAPSNGEDVTPEGYVNGIRGIIDFALNSKFMHILCVLDREKRTISASDLAERIRDELISIILKNTKFTHKDLDEKIKVVVADRMFENWIVADIEGIKSKPKLVNQAVVQEKYDGRSGVKMLKECMTVNYDKVCHAKILFKAVSFDRACQNSPSFQNFISALDV